MDMKKILQNMDDAATGNKPTAGAESTNEMKTILESLQNVSEGGYPMPPATMPQEDKGHPVSMNVSVNASGKDNVQDLLDLMKSAGLQDAKPMDKDMMPMRMDMERLRDIVDVEDVDADEEIEQEGYVNEPDEQYDDHETMIHDLSGGINRKKKQYAKAQDGDNAMSVESIKEQLLAALLEKKAKPDFLDLDGDDDTDESMKDAAKDAGKDDDDKDDSKGLTDKQKKLPKGLQKAIAKKNESVNENKDQIISDAERMDLDEFVEKYTGEGMSKAEAVSHWKNVNESVNEEMDRGDIHDNLAIAMEFMNKAIQKTREVHQEFEKEIYSTNEEMDLGDMHDYLGMAMESMNKAIQKTREVHQEIEKEIYSTDESVNEEGKKKGVDKKACWDGYKYAGRERKPDGTYKDICRRMSAKEKNK